MKKHACVSLCAAGLAISVAVSGISRGDAAAVGPIKISFTLPKDAYVTLVVEDEKGRRVKNLIAEQPLKAGANSISWDGYTETGGLVRPGNYRWRGLYRDQLNLEYQFSAYTANGQPPWFTTAVQQGTDSGWLSDHNPPVAACAAGDQIFLGTITSEAGQDVMAVGLDGRKRWGISHPYGVGAKDLAYDGKLVYAAGEGQWAGANGCVFSIDPVTYATAKVWDHKGYLGLRGMAAHNAKLYLASDVDGKLLVLDPPSKQVLRQTPLPRPGGVAEAPDGRLLAVSGTSIVEILDDGALRPLVENSVHLTHPNRMAIGRDGTIFITDGPTSWNRAHDPENNAQYGPPETRIKGDNQVKVFDAKGQFLRAIGTPGGRKPGPYDPQAMRCPVGVTVDGMGHVWVAEWDMLPKRFSVWNAAGQLVQEFIGSHKYGGGGALDPGDRTTMIYDGMLFKLDWEHGTWKMDSTIVPIMNAESEDKHTFGGYADWPSRIIRLNGQQYFVSGNDDISGSGGVSIWMRKGASFQPVAHVGPYSPLKDGKVDKTDFLYPRMVEMLGDKAPGGAATDIGGPPGEWNTFTSYTMIWSDQNGDGIVQPQEVVFSDKPHYWLAHPYIAPDLSIFLRNPAHRGITSIWRLPVAHLDAAGVPGYDIAKLETVREDIPNSEASSGALEVDKAGGLYMNASSIYGLEPRTHALWSYPSPWPMFGDKAPHQKPGLVIANYSVRGVADAGGDAGTIVAINSDFGQWYLFTSDGLFLSTLFGDTRTAPYWGTHFKEAKRGMLANGVSLGQESFFGSMNKSSDGNIYIVAGHPHCSVIKLNGLDSIKRFQGTFTVAATAILAAGRDEETRAVAERALKPAPTMALPAYSSVVASNYHPGYNLDPVSGRFPHSAAEYAFDLGYDDNGLVIRATMPHLLNNSKDLQHLFATGDAAVLELGLDPQADPARTQAAPGDVRIVVTRFQGEPVAVLYRYKTVDGKTTIDQVNKIEGADVKVEPFHSIYGSTLALVARVPWKALPSTPASFGPKVELRGDVGFVIGNDAGTAALQRINWANKATGVVGDMASQTRLMPQLWGIFNPQPKNVPPPAH